MKRLRTPNRPVLAVKPRALSVSLARFSSSLAVCAALMAGAGSARAAADLWVGDAFANWSTGVWTGGNNPPIAGDSLLFGVAGAAGTALTNDLTAALSFTGITFNPGASAFTIGGNSITLASGGITNSSTALQTINLAIAATTVQTLTMTAAGGDLALGGVISGTGGGLTLTGTGAVSLSGINTYTGNTTIAANTQLNFNNTKAIGTGTLVINGGTLDNTTAGAIINANTNAQTWAGSFAFAGSQALNLGTGAVAVNAAVNPTITANGTVSTATGLLTGNTLTEGGVITFGANNLTVAGTGGLILTGANTGTGTVTVNSGAKLQVGNQTVSGALPTGALSVAGTLIEAPATGALVTVANTISGAGNITLTGNTASGPSGIDLTSASNAGFTGTYTLNQGRVRVSTQAQLGATTAAITVNGSGTNGGQLWINANVSIANPITINGVGPLESGGNLGAIRFNTGTYAGQITLGSSARINAQNTAVTISGNILGGAGSVLTYGPTAGGTVTITSAGGNTYSGGTQISGPAIAANVNNALGTGPIGFTTGNLTLAANVTQATPSLTFNVGSAVTVSGGAGSSINLGVAGNIDASAVNTTLINSISAVLTGTGGITIKGSGDTSDSGGGAAGYLSLTGANTFTGNASITGGLVNPGTNDTPFGTISNAIVLNGGGLLANVSSTYQPGRTIQLAGTGFFRSYSGQTLAITGPITGAGTLRKTDGGSLTLTGPNNYSGTTVVNAGIVNANSIGALGTSIVTVGGGTLNQSLANALNGSGQSLTVTAGTANLSFGNTYTGGTTVSGTGILNVTNTSGSATGSGSVTLNSGGVLTSGPTGSFSGTVLSSAGVGTITPGGVGGFGTLGIGGLTVSTGTGLSYDLSTPSGSNDLINVTGLNGLTVPGGAAPVAINLTPSVPGTYHLIGFSNDGGTALPTAANFSIPSGTPNGRLTFTVNINPVSGNAYFVDLTAAGNATPITTVFNNPTPLPSAAGADWNDPGNWSAGVPGLTNDTVTINNGAASPATTINLNGQQHAGSLTFANSGAATYTLAAGTGTSPRLFLDTGTLAGPATLANSTNNNTISAPVVLSSNTSASAANGTTLTLSGAISGPGSFTLNSAAGAGSVLLSVANTYTGGTNVLGGTLKVGNATALSTGPVVVSGGSLDLNGTTIATALTLNGTGNGGAGALINSGAAATESGPITLGSNATVAGNMTLSGIISGPFQLSTTGAGAVTLTGANTFTGGLNITGGSTVVVGILDGVLGGAGSGITLNGGTLSQRTAGTLTVGATRVINLAGAGTIDIQGAGSAQKIFLSTAGQLTGSGALTKTGGGDLQMSAANAGLSSNWTISAGFVEVQNARALGTGTVTIGGTGELVNGNVLIDNAITLNSGALISANTSGAIYSGPITANGNFTAAARQFQTVANATNFTIGGLLSGAGNMSIIGSTTAGTNGTVLINTANLLTGTTYSGTISLGAQGILGLANDGDGLGTPNTITLTPVTTTLTFVAGNGGYAVGRIGAASTFNQAVNKTISIGTLLNNAANLLAVTPFNGYGLALSNNITLAAAQSYTVNGTQASNIVQGLTLSGKISGGFGITKGGAGTMVLIDATNDFGLVAGSPITITQGVLSISNDGQLGQAANNIVLTPGAGLSSALRATGGTVILPATRSIKFGNATDTRTIEVANGSTLQLNRAFDISAFPAANLSKNELGTLEFAVDNTGWTGALTINAGAVKVPTAAGLGTGGATVANNVNAVLQLTGTSIIYNRPLTLNNTGINSGGALQNVSGTNTWTGAITLASAATIGVDSGTLTLTPSTLTPATFALTLTGAGSGSLNTGVGSTGAINKLGSGTWTLTAANSTTGALNVSGPGTLKFSGAGAMTASTGTYVFGQGSTVFLDNSGTNVNSRLGTRPTYLAGELKISGNSTVSTPTTENFGTNLAPSRAGAIITLTPDAANPLTLTSSGAIARDGGATLLIRGTNLGNTPGNGVATVKPTTAFIFIGQTGLAGTNNRGILPWVVVDQSATGFGTAFATYDATTNGVLRLGQVAGETSATIVANANVATSSGITAPIGTTIVNSLTLGSGGGVITPDGSTLQLDSGGVLALTGNTGIGSSFRSILTSTSNRELMFHVLDSTTPANNPLLTINSTITGSTGGLTKADHGTLEIVSPAYYSGATQVNGGTLKLTGGTNTLLANQPLNLNHNVNSVGTLDLAGNAQFVGTLATSGTGGADTPQVGGAVTSSTGTGTLVTNMAGSATFAGQIKDSVFFARSGGSTLSLSGDNTYTGGTLLNGGITVVRDAGKLSGTGAVAINYSTLMLFNDGLQDDSNRLADGKAISLRGGTLAFKGRNNTVSTELVGDVTAVQGTSVISSANGSSVATLLSEATLTLTSLSRTAAAGATIGFAQIYNVPAGSAVGSLGTIGTAERILVNGGMTNTNNIVGPWAASAFFFPTTQVEFASYNSTFGVGSLNTPGFAGYDGTALPATSQPGQNIRLAAGGVVPSGGVIVNTLNLASNQTGAVALTFAGPGTGDVLNLAGGGLMVQNVVGTAGATSIGTTANPGVLTAGGATPSAPSDLFLYYYANGTAALTINSQIANSPNNQPVRLIPWGGIWGSNTIILAHPNNTYSGGTIINQNTVQIGAAGTPSNLPAGGLTINGGAVTQVNGTIGAQTVNLNGSSTLTLLGTNTLTSLAFDNNGGATAPTVNTNGVLTLTGAAPISASSNNVTTTAVINGVLDLNGAVNPTLDIGAVTVNGVNVAPLQPGLNIAASIQDATGILKTGTGLVQLGGSNTFGGTFDLQNGGVIFASSSTATNGPVGSGTLQVSGNITVLTADATLRFVNNPLTLGSSAANLTLGNFGAQSLILSGATAWGTGMARTITVNATNPQTLAGVITGTGSLTKTGLGTLVLTGNNAASLNWGGSQGVNVQAGVLQINSDAALGAAPGTLMLDNVVLNGSTLSAIAPTTLHANRGVLIGSPTAAGTATFDVVTLSHSLEVAGIVADNGTGGDSLIKTGAGTLILSGLNTYTGTTTLVAGALRAASSTALGISATTLTIPTGTALQIAGNSTIAARPLILSGAGIANDGALRNISGANSFAGAVTLATASRINSDAGTLTLTGGISGTATDLTVGGAGNVVIDTVGLATTTGKLTKEGAGILTLSANGSFSGVTSIAGGTVELTGSSGALSSTTAINLTNGGTLKLTNSATANSGTRVNDASALSSSGGSLIFQHEGAAATNYSEALGTLTLNGGQTSISTSQAAASQTSTLTFANLIRNSGATLNFADNGLGASTQNRIVFTQINTAPPVPGPLGGWATVGSAFAQYVDIGSGNFSVAPIAPVVLGGETTWLNDTLADTPAPANDLLLDSASNRYLDTLALSSGTALTVSGTANNALTIKSGIVSGNADHIISVPVLKFGQQAPTVAVDLPISVNSNSLTISSTVANNIAGNANFATSLTKGGAGTLVLTGANTFTGGVTLNGGTVVIGHDFSLGRGTAAGALTLNGGTLTSNGATPHTLLNPTTLTADLVLGDAVNSGALTFTGAVTGGANNHLVTINNPAANYVSLLGAITSTGTFTKAGPGTLLLMNAANTFGALNVTGGTLLNGNGGINNLGVNINITLTNGGTLGFLSGVDTFNPPGSSKVFAFGTGGGGILVAAGASIVIDDAGQLGNSSGDLTKTGGGVFKFGYTSTGSPGYANLTGQIFVNDGTLLVGHLTSLGSNATGQGTTIASGAALGVYSAAVAISGEPVTVSGTGIATAGAIYNDQAFALSFAPGAGSGTFTLAGDTSISSTNTGGITISSNITETGGSRSLTKVGTGAGALILQGANTYSGPTLINAGTLTLSGTAGSIDSSSGIVLNGGTLTLVNTAAANNIDRIADTATITSNGGTIAFSNTAGATGFVENLNTLLLNRGATTISTVQNTLGASALTFASLSRPAAGATVNFTGTGLGLNVQNQIVFTAAPTPVNGIIGGWATVDNNFAKYVAGSVTPLTAADYITSTDASTWATANNLNLPVGTTTLTPAGGATVETNSLNLSTIGATTPNAALDLSGKTLRLVSGGILSGGSFAHGAIVNGTLTAGNGANTAGELVFNVTQPLLNRLVVSANLVNNGSGAVAVTKSGTGTLILNNIAANTFTGALTASGGNLVLVKSVATASSVAVNPGATLSIATFDGSSPISATNTLALNGGTFTNFDNVGRTFDNAVVIGGDVALGSASPSGGLITLGAAATAKTFDLGGTTRTLTVSNANPVVVNDIVSDTASAGFVKAGTGILTLAGANTYTGATTATGGTLRISVDNNLGVAPASATPKQLFLTGATLNAVSNLTLNSNRGVFLGQAGGTFDVNFGATLTYGGVIDGGNLTKAGIGTLVLGGGNTYAGTTAINAGVLRATTSDALGLPGVATTVAAGAALELSGSNLSFSGAEPLTISSGGINNAGALRNITGNNTWGGLVTIAAQARINSDAGTLILAQGATSANLTLVVGGAGNLVVEGPLTLGSGGLSKDGAGQITLLALNTYTGSTAVNDGTVELSGPVASVGSTAFTVTGGGTLRITNSLAAASSARIADAATLTFSGNGTFNFAHNGGPVNYAETLGQLIPSSGAITLATSQADAGQTSAVTFGAAAGLGTRGLGAAVNFTGAGLGLDTRNRVVLNAQAAGLIGGWATVGDEFAKYDTGVGSVTAFVAGDYSIDPAVTGYTTGLNIKATTSPAALGASRTINTLNLAQASAVTLDIGAGNTLRVEKGGLLVSGAFNSIIQNGTLTAGQTSTAIGDLVVHQNSAANTLDIQSVIADSGGSPNITTLTKTGPGTLQLSGNNTFTGGVFVDNGVVVLNNAGALNSTTKNGVTMHGGTLRLNNQSPNIANLAGANPNAIIENANATGHTLTVTNTSNSVYTGLLQDGVGGGALGLTKADTNFALTLNNPASTYSGVTTIVGTGATNVSIVEAFKLADGGQPSSIGAASSAAANLVFNGGILRYTGLGDNTTNRLFTLGTNNSTGGGTGTITNLAGGTIDFSNTGSIAFSGSAARVFNLQGLSTGDNFFRPQLGDGGGVTSVNKGGTGRWILTNNSNSYTGIASVNAGTLAVTSAGALGSATGETQIVNGAFLELNNITGDIAEPIRFITNNGGNVTVVGGAPRLTGTVTMLFDGIFTVPSGTSLTLGGSVASVAATARLFQKSGDGILTIQPAAGTPTYNWGYTQVGVSNSATGGILRLVGTGSVNNNVGTGAELRVFGGVLDLSQMQTAGAATFTAGNSTAATQINLGNAVANAPATILLGNNTLAFAGTTGGLTYSTASVQGGPATIGDIGAVSGNFDLAGVARTFLVNDSSNAPVDLTVNANVIGGAASLIKTGAGTLQLGGANTYTGVTTISDGTVILDYTLNPGGKLSDTATVSFGGITPATQATSTLGPLVLQGLNSPASVTETIGLLQLNAGLSTLRIAGSGTTLAATSLSRLQPASFLTVDLPAGGIGLTLTNSQATGAGALPGVITTEPNGVSRFMNSTGAFTGTTNANASTWTDGADINATTGFTNSVTTDLKISSLRYDANAASTVAVAAGKGFGSTSGTFLVTSTAAANNIGIGTAGSTLESLNTLHELDFVLQNTGVTTFSGDIRSDQTVMKQGPGILGLAGNSTYQGPTYIFDGSVRPSGGKGIGDNSPIILSLRSSPVGVLDLNGATETVGGLEGGTTTVTNVKLVNGTLVVNQAADKTLSGILDFGGTGTFTKQGPGTLTIQGNGAGNGTVNVFGGMLTLGSVQAASGIDDVGTINIRGGVLQDTQLIAAAKHLLSGTNVNMRGTASSNGFYVPINQNSAITETTNAFTFAEGANTLTFEHQSGTGTATVSTLLLNSGTDGWVRTNGATVLLRGPNLGTLAATTATSRVQVTLPGSFSAAELVGGAGAAAGSTALKIIPHAIGGTAFSGAGSEGNTFVTYGTAATVTSNNLRPLTVATEYATAFVGGVATDNVNFAAAPAISAVDETVNALRLDTSTAAFNLTGTATKTLTLTSGALLMTAGTTTNGLTLGGFSNLTASATTNELVVFVTSSNATPAAATLSISSNIIGAGVGLTKAGAGTLALTAATANTFTGALTVNQGVLSFTALNQLGTGSAIRLAGGTLLWSGANTSDITNGHAITLLGPSNGTLTGSGATAPTIVTTNTAQQSILDVGANDVVFTQAFGGAGSTGGVTKIGAGNVTLNAAAASRTGTTQIDAGTVTLGVANALGAGGIIVNGGTLASGAGNNPTGRITLLGGSISGLGVLTTSDDLIDVGLGTINATLAEVANTRARLLKTGTGLVTIGGTNNSFTGITEVQAGTLAVASLANLGSNSSLGTGSYQNGAIRLGYLGNTGTLQYVGTADGTTNRPIELSGTTGGGILDNSSATNNKLVLTGTVSSDGSGNILGAATGTAKTLSLTGTSTGANEISGVISDPGANEPLALVKIASGANTSWKLSGNNTFTGNVGINGGAVIITNSNALGSGTKTITISPTTNPTSQPALRLDGSGGAITLPASMSFTTSYDALNGTTPIAGAGAIINDGGNNIIQGNFSLTSGGGGTTFLSNAGKLTLTGALTPIAATRSIFLRGNGDGEISGLIVDGTTVGLPVTREVGTGTWTLSNVANSYTGITSVKAGTLAVVKLRDGGLSSSIGASTSIPANLVLDGGALQYTGAGDSTNRQMTLGVSGGRLDASGSGAVNFTSATALTLSGTNTARALTLSGTSTLTNSLAAALVDNGSGATSLIKSGAGTWAVSGTNSYTGPTNVTAGTLLINGVQGSATGAVTVSSGATLGGTGVIGGATTVQNGGSLKPGASAGLLTFTNNLTLGGNATNTTFELQGTARGTAGGYDAIDLGASSTLTYAGILTLDISSTLPNGTYDLFKFTNASTGDFFNVTLAGSGGYSGSLTNTSGVWTGDSQGQNFTFTQATGDLVIGVVPEPGALVSLLGGLGALLGFRRARRRV
ncbi:MAG: fibronectin-binding autotransporter adhesin [Chthoniobacter sp.]|jgi:autotransporter-associated beta strand protein|nr:fibronectin-binding autotransporter adhesin [Chthoniobacter sp.]